MEYNKETKTLTINFDFNEELKNIPKDVKIIIFNNKHSHLSYFNQKVDNLPQSLIHLTFGIIFDQKVDKLPKNLTHLIFCYYFNQKVDNLPKNLTHLTFGSKFTQIIDVLPKNLKYLKLGWISFNDKIILPESLKELCLSCGNKLINNIPKNIEKLCIYFYDCDFKVYNKKVENLPLTIKEIVIQNEQFKKYIKIPFGCKINIQSL
jgi:hypothetical protein